MRNYLVWGALLLVLAGISLLSHVWTPPRTADVLSIHGVSLGMSRTDIEKRLGKGQPEGDAPGVWMYIPPPPVYEGRVGGSSGPGASSFGDRDVPGLTIEYDAAGHCKCVDGFGLERDGKPILQIGDSTAAMRQLFSAETSYGITHREKSFSEAGIRYDRLRLTVFADWSNCAARTGRSDNMEKSGEVAHLRLEQRAGGMEAEPPIARVSGTRR